MGSSDIQGGSLYMYKVNDVHPGEIMMETKIMTP